MIISFGDQQHFIEEEGILESDLETFYTATNFANMTSLARFPVYAISHGAPNLVLQKQDPATKFLANLGKSILKIGQPKAILMISAHWESHDFAVTSK